MSRQLSPAKAIALLAVVVVLAVAGIAIAQPLQRVEKLLENAYQLASRDLVEWAASYFQDATQENPTNLEGWLMGGLAWYVSGKEEQALKAWAMAEGLGSGAAASLTGDALYARGDITGAEAAYQRALAKQPYAAKPMLGLALVTEKRGKRESAIAQLQAILEAPPGVRAEEHMPMTEVYYHLGRLYLAGGQAESALPVLKRGVQVSPYHGGMYLLLGQAYEARGALAEAVHAYERALQLVPGLSGAEEGLLRLRH